jgi:hypothetical protein
MSEFKAENSSAEATRNEVPTEESRFVRVSGACKALSIRRTRVYELLNEANGQIKTLALKSPGAKRGARLIHLPSLFAYLEQMAEQQQSN